MKTIAERNNKLKAQFLYLIIGMLVFLVLIMWLKEVCKTEKPEPQATLMFETDSSSTTALLWDSDKYYKRIKVLRRTQ